MAENEFAFPNKPFLLFMVRLIQILTHVFEQQTVVNEKVNVPSKNLNN